MTLPPFDFSHYFTYTEIDQFLQQCQAAYPHLVSVQKIGQSYGGRDIWVAIATHQATGHYQDKPGFWIDANTHAGEVTGSAVALYCLYQLLTRYGTNPQVTQLLDQHTVYVLPRLAMDGAEKYLTTPYLLRSSIRPYPHVEEREGLYPEDINQDGLILTMRIKDDCGAWKISDQDPRVMVGRSPAEFGGDYYTLLPEGLIREADGYEFQLAPSLEGLDFNRNYPHRWAPEGQQQGAGDFPFSEPETRAEAEFWQQHRNINGFISYHTYSAVILRPYAAEPDEYFPTEDLEVYKLIGEQGKKLTGYDCLSPYHDFRYHPKEVIYGVMDDYGYDHYGWFGFTVELWDAPTAAGVEKESIIEWFRWHPPEDDLTLMRWNDETLNGEGFVDWQPFDHPQLGLVEVGGWRFKDMWQNAPAQFLPELCEQHFQFALCHALLSPRLALAKLDIAAIEMGVYRLAVQWENQGFLPTYTSQKALERKIVKPIQVTVIHPDSVKLVAGKQKQELPHLEGRSNKAKASLANGMDYRRHLEWIVQGRSGDILTITAQAERAGTVVTEVVLP